MGEKSPGAFRTIGEVADELDLPQHVLRFWETKFSQIRPTKRSSGRRFYRPEDVDLVRTIRDLLYKQGYTIRGVQQVLRDRSARRPSDEHAEAVTAVSPAAVGKEPEGEQTDVSQSGLANVPVAILSELRACLVILRNARTTTD